jgi:hypothetical protein
MSRIWTIVGVLALALAITPRFFPVPTNEPNPQVIAQSIGDQKDMVIDEQPLTEVIHKLIKLSKTKRSKHL